VDVGLHRLLRPGCCAAHHGHRGVARRMRWPDSSDLLVIKIKIDWVMLSNHRSISIHIYIYPNFGDYISNFEPYYGGFMRKCREKLWGSHKTNMESKKNGGFERHFSMSFWVIPYWPLAFFGRSMLKFLHFGHVSPRCTPTQVYEELGKLWHDLTLSWHDGR
jgi:hypothetical protein